MRTSGASLRLEAVVRLKSNIIVVDAGVLILIMILVRKGLERLARCLRSLLLIVGLIREQSGVRVLICITRADALSCKLIT